MSEIVPQAEDVERMVRRYKNDPTINQFLKSIERVLTHATPSIRIHLGDFSKSEFSIDENSKLAIEYWKGKMEEYIEINYPEFKLYL